MLSGQLALITAAIFAGAAVYVKAEFNDATPHPFSGASVEVPITAVNDAPVAAADANYSTFSNTKLTVPNPGPPPVAGVLANDSDVDSPSTSIKAVLVQGPMNAKQFTFNPDGSFTYTPKPGFFDKTDSFTYKANDGAYTETSPAFTAPMSPDSNTVTVTITVIKR